jgi:putative oxidoreductase
MKGFSAMFRRIISTSASWTPVPLRLILAAVFIAHGAQKVLGSFGGPGLSAFTTGPTAQTPFPFMRPAWLWLGAAALSELLGGILILVGLLTRVGAFLIACTMLTAVVGVHWSGGFFASNKGYEYPLVLFAVSLALLISGGGMASIDRGLSSGRRR